MDQVMAFASGQTLSKNGRFRDLTGQRFGKLLVLSPTNMRANSGRVVWRCRCDCGNLAEVSARSLIREQVRSCGCPLKDKLAEALVLYYNTSVAILERDKKRLLSSNTSGYTGVFHAKDGKCVAYISFKKKRYWLGRYEKKEDAIKTRKCG